MSARTKARPAPAGPSRPDWTDVLASIEDGVVVIDPVGVVADLNPAAEQLVGVSAPQAVGRPADDLFGALHWAGELVRDTLAQGVARRRGEGLLRSRRGDVEVSAACAPLHDGDGTVAGAVLVLRDLTLQRTLEATGRRAERLRQLNEGLKNLGLDG